MKAAPHPRQAARLAALQSYEILDTPRESDFDELVELAATICGTPISVVNLIDADRQWFKAETGLGVRETPLDTSLCAHAILEQDFMEIEDTLTDRRMADNALCTGEPGLRFYAGALLQTEDGLPLGTLCVLDYRSRKLDDFQRRSLQVIARQVMKQLDLRRALKIQNTLVKEIDHRVKNSLQAVSSLVALQRGQSKDASVKAALDDVAARLQTISLVHDELSLAGASETVDLGRYLNRLGNLLGRNAGGNVAVVVEAKPLIVDSRLASSVGMIVSEFAANSLKHAFPDGRAGTIRIAMRGVEDGMAELVCADDGVGASPAAGVGKPGLGLRIIAASVSQIGGRMQQSEAGPGLSLRIVFPLTHAASVVQPALPA